MILHFNVTGEKRKELVKVMEAALGTKAKYLGMPTAAYQVGEYTVEKDGTVTWGDMVDADSEVLDSTSNMIDSCVTAGFKPEEWENLQGPEETGSVPEQENTDTLTIELPREQFTDGQIKNLQKLIHGKERLLKQALAIDVFPVETTEEKILFPWFHLPLEPEEITAYTKLIGALGEMAKKVKRVTLKDKEVENPKYAFRCFLLRLGLVGAEYKQDRKILLKNLTGSSAFKSGVKKGSEE